MLKIILAPLSRMRNGQHLHLMIEMIRLILEETSEKLGISSLFPTFQSAVATENIAVEVERGSGITEKIDDLVIQREKFYGGFNHLIENGLVHFDPAKVDAAKRVSRVVDKYANILRKTRAEKFVDFNNLTLELQNPENGADVLLLGAQDWVMKVFVLNAEGLKLNGLRIKETGARPDGNVGKVRKETDISYNAIVNKINALVLVNGEDNYRSFITQLNGVIDSLKITMAQQQGITDKTPETKGE